MLLDLREQDRRREQDVLVTPFKLSPRGDDRRGLPGAQLRRLVASDVTKPPSEQLVIARESIKQALTFYPKAWFYERFPSESDSDETS